MRLTVLSSWLLTSAVFLTVLLGPQPAIGLPSADFAGNSFREVKGIAGTARDDVKGFVGNVVDKATIHDVPVDASMAGIPRQFWEGALSLGQSPHDYVMNLIEGAAKNVEPIVAAKMNHAITSMHAVVSDIGKLKLTIAQAHGVSFDDIENEIETALARLWEELKEQFPPPDQAPNHEERQASVSLVLRQVKEALIKLCVQYGMPEDQLRAHLDPIMEHVETIVVTLGDLEEQHPRLFRLLIIAGVLLILPKYWCPLLRMFGIGPEGPIKGSVAAWAQSIFFGAYVPKGSWFSLLQYAGMTGGCGSAPDWSTVIGFIMVLIGAGEVAGG